MTEAQYQNKVIIRLEHEFPGCVVMKNDPAYQQGLPDLTVLYKKRWATLEVKKSKTSVVQPNQQHFVQKLDRMSFASFLFPENEEEVFSALEQAFAS